MQIIIILITSIIISNHPVKESCGAERKLQSPSFPICHVPNESRRLSTESSYVQSMMLSRRRSTESSYVQSMMLSRRLSTESSYVQSMMLSRRLSTESSYVQSMMLSRRLSTESSYVQSMMLSRRLSTESSYVQSMMLSRRLSTESSYVQSMMLSRRLSTESSYVQSMMLSSNTCVGIPDLLIHSTGMCSVNITLNQSMATRNVSEVNGWVSTKGLDDVGTYFDTGCLTFETVISNPFTDISIHV